jgi:hypothetical protein
MQLKFFVKTGLKVFSLCPLLKHRHPMQVRLTEHAIDKPRSIITGSYDPARIAPAASPSPSFNRRAAGAGMRCQ